MTSTLPSKLVARLSGHKGESVGSISRWDHVWKLQKTSNKLHQIAGPIHAVTYSAGTGQYILSGSSDRCVNLWNPANADGSSQSSGAALIQSYSGAHTYEVLSVAVASDNARFASGGGDKSAVLWDVASAKVTRRLGVATGGHSGKIESVKFGGEGDSVVVTGSYDATVRLWDIKAAGGRPLMVLSEGKDSVSDVAVTGWEVGAACVDGRVRWYDLRMGVCLVDVVGGKCMSISRTT